MQDLQKISKLFIEQIAYKPFVYDWAYDAYKTQNQMHWLPEEVSMSDDVNDWKNKMTEPEKFLCSQIFKFFTQADVDVANNYSERYLSVFKNNEIKMMLSAFNNMESIHVDSYSHLITTLGMSDDIYAEFLNYKEMVAKHEYSNSFKVDTLEHIALTLAGFGAFTEGLQLFASFAILLNFQRFGKMKGMGQIIAFSAKDECYSDDTEILTADGWKLFKDLSDEDIVAQFDKDTKEITFVKPKRIVSYDVDKEMAVLNDPGRPINFMVTPHHRTLTYIDDKPIVDEAQDLKIGNKRYLPTSGYARGNSLKEFTPLDQLFIVMCENGYSSTVNMENIESIEGLFYFSVKITKDKEQKINRFKEILKNCNIKYGEHDATIMGHYGDHKKCRVFNIDIPIDIMKKFSIQFKDWIKLEDVTSDWADKFIQFLVDWSGYDNLGRTFYIPINNESADTIQAIATLGGWSTNTVVGFKGPNGLGKKIYRIRLWKKDKLIINKKHKIKYVPYKGKVWCVEVETGFLVVRRNNKVCISGNTLHTNHIIKLFHTLIEENPELWTEELRKQLYEMCNKVVYFEDAFVDLAFGIDGAVQGMEKEDVKQYIRYIADQRLTELKLKPIYLIKDNPLPWMDYILNGKEHVNFFENRVTEYMKGTLTGDWQEAFTIHDQL